MLMQWIFIWLLQKGLGQKGNGKNCQAVLIHILVDHHCIVLV